MTAIMTATDRTPATVVLRLRLPPVLASHRARRLRRMRMARVRPRRLRAMVVRVRRRAIMTATTTVVPAPRRLLRVVARVDRLPRLRVVDLVVQARVDLRPRRRPARARLRRLPSELLLTATL